MPGRATPRAATTPRRTSSMRARGSGVAAGVRRIEAVTGAGAVAWAQQQRAALHRIVDALHVGIDQGVDTIERLQTENKKLARDITQLRTKLALGSASPASSGDAAD